MKVGTDANILGVWCNLQGSGTALDIGTGSGVIAMILASRSAELLIEGIEIDDLSAIEASENFSRSPYSHRLKLIHQDFKEYILTSEKKYDLIITNPPFFSNFPISPKNNNRNKARHTLDLDHYKLVEGVSKLLSDAGRFNIVIPFNIHKSLISIAAEKGLYLFRQLLIYPKPGKEPNRINMEFRFTRSHKVLSDDFYVRNSQGELSDQYKSFFKEHLTDF